MKHECFWDEDHGCAFIKLYGELTPEQAEVLMDQLEALYVGKSQRLLLIDHSDSPQATGRATREVLERRGQVIDYERLGFYGMTNLNRIVARIIVTLLGRAAKTQFFVTREEALAWICSR